MAKYRFVVEIDGPSGVPVSELLRTLRAEVPDDFVEHAAREAVTAAAARAFALQFHHGVHYSVVVEAAT